MHVVNPMSTRPLAITYMSVGEGDRIASRTLLSITGREQTGNVSADEGHNSEFDVGGILAREKTPSSSIVPFSCGWCPMRLQSKFSAIKLLAVVATLLFACSDGWAASQYKVLYAFKGGNDGNYPEGALVFDSSGNLYGTTIFGGVSKQSCSGYGFAGCGTVFMLTRGTGGGWTESVLHAFQAGDDNTDGAAPNGALIFDAAGDLYGTTSVGGGADEQCSSGAYTGCGIVFELAPASGGSWTETVLYRFQINAGGAGPYAGLVFDNAGNLYGTAAAAGNCCNPLIFGWGAGVVFQLTKSSGGWSEDVLHSFCSQTNCKDGNAPYSGLLRAPDGILYGTTAYGGSVSFPCYNLGCGTVFKLDLNRDEQAYPLNGMDGVQPYNSLTADAKGNLYGTTTTDGAFGDGTVFKLSPTSDGRWKFTVLYNFHIGYVYSGSFSSGVVFDNAGNLYGTIWGPNSGNCGGGGCGLVYKLEPQPAGPWKYSEVYTFTGGQDGGEPDSTLIIDKDGNLYGTAAVGGAGYGVVFEITP